MRIRSTPRTIPTMQKSFTRKLLKAGPEAGALCALVFAALFPALFGGFVWDDNIFTDARAVQEWSGLWQIWFSPGDIRWEQHYWPVLYTSFWLEHKLWGLNPFSCHLINILLHLANTLLLWRLLARLAVPGAWLAAALFAVHPVHVEAAAWVIARKDLLATLFSLGCALVWLRFFSDDKAQPGLHHGAAVALLLVAALLSKSVAVTLPCALLLLYWQQHGRLPGRVVLWAAPLFLIAGGITAFDLYFYETQNPVPFSHSPVEKLLLAAQALCFYAGKLLWPADLAVIYPHWEPVSARGWLCLVAVIGVFVLLGCLHRRLGRGPLTGVLFFVLTLLPVLGFVDFSYMVLSFVADRYQYFASAGLLAVVAGGIVRLAHTLPLPSRRGLQLACVLGLGVLIWTSAQQATIYRDEIRFYSHITDRNPQAPRVHYHLSLALYQEGRALADTEQADTAHKKQYYQQAVEAMRKAIALEPDDGKAHQAIGVLLAELGQYAEARKHLRTALALEPDDHSLHYNTGLVLTRLGQYSEARTYLHKALEGWRGRQNKQRRSRSVTQLPPSPSLIRKEAERALQQKRYEEAVLFFRVLTDIQPGQTPAWTGLGEALRGTGQHEEAITALQQAITLDPDTPITPTLHVLIAHSAQTLGQDDTAIAHYQQALEKNASLVAALEGLAGLQFARGRYPEALVSFRRLAELSPDSAQAHSNLGAVLAELGQTRAAMRSLQRALDLNPQLEAARANLQRLKASLE